MEKVDLAKLEVAIKYIERMADGCNPVNNMPLSEQDVLNNPNIIRCMYFIKDILEEVRKNDGIIVGKMPKPGTMAFPVEVLDEFVYQEDKSITHVLKQIHTPISHLNVKKVSVAKVTSLLMEEGYLDEAENPDTKKTYKILTKKGSELGIYEQEREFQGKSYTALIYNQRAQEYVVELIRKWAMEQL